MNITKEKLVKKNCQEIFLVDDGFALGIAFFLKLLGQDIKFDSLGWEKEVSQYYELEIKRLETDYIENSKKKRNIEEVFNFNLRLIYKNNFLAENYK